MRACRISVKIDYVFFFFTWLASICILLIAFTLTTSRNPFRLIGRNVDWMDDKNLSIVVQLQDLYKDDYDLCFYLKIIYQLLRIMLQIRKNFYFFNIDQKKKKIIDKKINKIKCNKIYSTFIFILHIYLFIFHNSYCHNF